MLHLVETQRSFASKLHQLSRYGDNYDASGGARGRRASTSVDLTWPFMCVSINLTKDALQCLRSGQLNKKCNKRKEVLSVLNDLHHALFLDFAK